MEKGAYLSQWRRQLVERLGHFDGLIRSLDLCRAQVRASLYRHRIRCGRPECHCARDAGHRRWCVSFSSSRGRHTRTLSPEELQKITPAAEAYRHYRQIRARAAGVARQIFGLIDRISRALERPVERTLKARR